MPCWEAALTFSNTQKSLCLTDRTGDKKDTKHLAFQYLCVGWWFKLQSFKNLALSKLEPCPGGFFSLYNKFRKHEKRNIFPVTQHMNNICTSEWVQNTFGMKGFSLWTGKKPFRHAPAEGKSRRDWAVWFHCKVAGREPPAGLTLHWFPGPWALRPCSTTRRPGNGSEEPWHYLSPEDLKASCHLNCR